MSESKARLLIGVIGSLLLLVTTFQMTDASHVEGEYLPVGHDAFYHASRILGAVETGRIAQFDPKMHAPDGDWVTWPWAFDAVIATVVRQVSSFSGKDPMAVATHLPPLLGVVGVWLVLAVATLLRLPTVWVAAAVGCFALHAFSQYQFGVGALDHHGAEQLSVLTALVLGMRWLQHPEAVHRAALLGFILGLSLGVHASLIALQLPLLATLSIQWIRGESLPLRSVLALCGGLLGGALLVLLPAETFWQGRFDLYYLSGLQLYATVAAALFMLSIARWPVSPSSLLGIGVLVSVLAIPLVADVRFTADFVAGTLPAIGKIDEIRSPFAFLGDPQGLSRLNQVYTLLIWFAPIVGLASAWMLVRERDAVSRHFWVWSVTGLVAVLMQVRLGSLGIFFLYLPLLVIAWRTTAVRWPGRRLSTFAMITLLVIAYLPTLLFQLTGKRVPAMDQSYSSIRTVLPGLVTACHERPGVVLASPGDGHLIRFFTKCSVVSNNFRLTKTDIEKVTESLRLIGRPASTLASEAPYVDYVLARLIPPTESMDPVLFHELLNPQDGELDGFRSIVKAGVSRPDGSHKNFLGVFEVLTQSPTS